MALSGISATIASFLSGKGFSAAGVAAVLGVSMSESGINPSITNSIGAHGLFQWLGSRRTALQQLAASMGTNENDVTAQLDFLMQELQRDYPALLHELQTTTNPQQAAVDFVNIFERPGAGGDPGAAGFAQTFFNGGVPGGAGNPGTATQGITGTDQGVSASDFWKIFSIGMGISSGISPNNVKEGITGVAKGLAGVVGVLNDMLGLFMKLFEPGFWVRVLAFFLGIIFLGGGWKALHGAM